ncbi:MAG: NifU N-terminal domain-containing protein, partial [Planctomycetota bacterium]
METSISVEMTPHPDIERFIFHQTLGQEDSLLTEKLLTISEIVEVILAENYVQITRKKNANWLTLEEKIETILQEYLSSGISVVQEKLEPQEISYEEPLLPIESTPNPQTKKILVPGALVSAPQEFLDFAQTQHSPLAMALFQIPGIASIFIAPYYVSLTKKEDFSWFPLESKASAILMKYLQSGGSAVSETKESERLEDGSLTQQIQAFLVKEIRPGIAMDGGDVVFLGYQDGVVSLQLLGACRGCPHSAKTLNQGIERRLKAAFS